MTATDNLEEYDDPQLYDEENNYFTDDIEFVSQLAAPCNGSVIELACGTGRVAIPLAMQGCTVIGMDIHPGMLEQARRKSAAAGLSDKQIRWIEQDCCHMKLDTQANLIFMTGNSFQHFHSNEQQDQLLRSVYNHLEQGGLFVMDTRFPSAEELLQPEEEEYWRSYQDPHTDHLVEVSTISSYDLLTQIQHYVTIRRMQDDAGQVIHEQRSNIHLRYTFPQELERLLNNHGFTIINRYQDWKSSPLTRYAKQMVYLCQKA